MTIDSYLDSGALRSACTEYIIYLQNENDSYNTVLSRIDAFLGNTSSDSVAINALKSQLSYYIPAVNLLIKANEYDIDCCHKLCDNCGSGVYDGYEILRNESKTQTSCINNLFMSESNKNKFNREIEQLANSNPTLRMLYNVSNFDIDDLSKNPTLYNTFIAEVSKMDPVLATYAQQMAQRKVLAAINKTEYNYWHSRHIEFDEIENLSNGLFVLSEEYRRIATMIILEISTSFNNGLYSKTPKTWNKIIEDIVNGIAISNEINHDINKPQIDRDSSDIDIEKLIKEYMFLSKNKDHWGDPVAREKAAQRMTEIEELLGLSAAQIFVFSIANAIKHCLDPAFTDKDVSSYVDFASGEANIDFDGHDDLTVDEIEDLIDEYERLEESRPHCPSKDAQDGILRRMHEIEDTISGYVDNAKNPNNLSEDEFNKLINEYYTYRDKDHWGDPTGRKIAGDRMREIEEILGLTQEEIYALAIAGSFMARIGKNDGKLKPSDSNTNKKIFNIYDSPLNSVPYEDVPVEDLTTEQVQTLIEKYRELCAQSNAYSLDPAISENIKKISQKLTDYNEYFLRRSNHSQGFTAAYKYMTRWNSLDELTEFVLYWKTIDDFDNVNGREMPKDWLKAHTTLPAEFINWDYDDEEVIRELCSNKELKTWYYENYFVIDLINGQPYYDDFVSHAYDETYKFKIDDPDEMQSEDVFYQWVQYGYPALLTPKEDCIGKIEDYLECLHNNQSNISTDEIMQQLEHYCNMFIDSANHSANFRCAYEYLRQKKYSMDSIAEYVLFWDSVDGYNSLYGHEMPESWCKEHLTKLNIDRFNVNSKYNSDDTINWYYDSYFILDLINGQPYAYGNDYDEFMEDNIKIMSNGEYAFFKNYSFGNEQYAAYNKCWDYMYGGVSDYANQIHSVRANKYFFDALMLGSYEANGFGFSGRQISAGYLDTNDYYQAYTNDATTGYRFTSEAFVYWCGLEDDFWNKIFCQDVSFDEQIADYIICYGSRIYTSNNPLPQNVIDMIEYESKSNTYEIYQCCDYVSFERVAQELVDSSRNSLSFLGYEIDETNYTITIRYSDPRSKENSNGYYPPQTVVFSFSDIYDCCGTKMISFAEYQNLSLENAEKCIGLDVYSDVEIAYYNSVTETTMFDCGVISRGLFDKLPQCMQDDIFETCRAAIISYDKFTTAYVDAEQRKIEAFDECAQMLFASVKEYLKYAAFFAMFIPGVNTVVTVGNTVLSISEDVYNYTIGGEDIPEIDLRDMLDNYVEGKVKSKLNSEADEILKKHVDAHTTERFSETVGNLHTFVKSGKDIIEDWDFSNDDMELLEPYLKELLIDIEEEYEYF